ncbi:ATP-grasp domain-containing protein [Nocardia implantans]|uniref:ATP-grasp domain-containing protein n=1 Tax=Nocardia implantans TaxID=3108168 RepID=A0ABU6AWN5_9NOCA|nr:MULTISPECIES: ATP-grasp domain-containing protein [unclassified Nocardia]MBF6193943.1 ATP-grasp domain-containing protein [Nocardia beijingensis]MEA3529318.1 ATP-grasp domain-containing protein [Nocardia sp. CDC192]MEB3511904.1 ATP-grasp domain-containing protein [Nocardia sp. CDC186]
MGHLLMVESWVGSMSTLLPAGIRDRGHTFSFLTRDLSHYLRGKPSTHPLLGAANVLTAETNDETALVAYVRRLHEVLAFDGVLSSCDYYLPTVAAIAADLGLPGPARDAVDAACRKDRTRALCQAAGVPGPAFAVSEDWGELARAATEIGYPLVVKPVDLCGGMYVRRVDDEQQLRAAVERIAGFPVNARGQIRAPQILVEECLAGPEFSVETVTVRGHTTVVGVTDKRLTGTPAFIEAGHMFPATLTDDEQAAVSAVARDAITALGLDDTVAHTEIKRTADGPRLIEVNPRPAGNRITELVRRVTGIDLAAVHAEVAAGDTPDLTPRPTGTGSAAIAFAVADRAGVLTAISGDERWDDDPRVVEHTLAEPGTEVRIATDNNTYLGHVMVVDEQPGAAGDLARDLIDKLTVDVARVAS